MTPEEFHTACTCPLAHGMRLSRDELERRGQRHLAALRTAFEVAEGAEVGSRAELRARLDTALAEAGVNFPPTFRDTWVRSQWALRGPRWARRPRVLWASVHGLAAGLRSLIQFARQAPLEKPPPSSSRGLTRLPGGVETDDVRGLAVSAAATVVFIAAARGRTVGVRRGLLTAATVSALPLIALVVVTSGLGFLGRALRGWQEEKDRAGSWPDPFGAP